MGSSSVILGSEFKNRVSYNRANINSLKVNELNLGNNNILEEAEKLKFANKTFRLTVNDTTYVEYIFNENSDLTVISTNPLGSYVFIRNVKLTKDNYVEHRYISGYTDSVDSDTVLKSFVILGMLFNEDYTEISIKHKYGGTAYIVDQNNPIAPLIHLSYPKEQQETVKGIIANGLLLRDSELNSVNNFKLIM